MYFYNNNKTDAKIDGFKPLPVILEIFLKESQMRKYYAAKRNYMYQHGMALRGMKWRRKIHGILLKLLYIDRIVICRHKVVMLNSSTNKPEPYSVRKDYIRAEQPVIFAITHMGMYDYQTISEVLKVHQYPFAGDPESMYRSFDGLMFWLNGAVVCDTEIKSDRKVAKATAIEVLKSGMNLSIYPEGVWNISPNLLVLPLFPGAVYMSKETGRQVVPIAIEQYGKKFVIKIGDAVSFNDTDVNTGTDILRDIMAGLKWDVIENQGITKRSELGEYETERKRFVDRRLNEWINP